MKFQLFKSIYLKILIFFANRYTLPEIYRKYYDIKIGHSCVFTGKRISFGSEPYLIEIGNNVRITADVKFITHDGGVGILRDKFPDINVFGKIKIGNNTFIGVNSIIMPGVNIGDNVVVGAGSVVTKNIPSNSVVVGVPAKVIMSIDEYEKKILNKSIILTTNKSNQRKMDILNSFIDD